MLLHIPHVLTPEAVAECRRDLAEADWVDGRSTVGHLGIQAKDNMQLPEDHPVAARLGELILGALEGNKLFIAGALPLVAYPPCFNRYRGGQSYGTHIDGAIRQVRSNRRRVRTDLSATIFLSAPDEYDGGELAIEDTLGAHRVKLPAGDMILYPASSLHHVAPVTRGERLAAFFWVQSMVRDNEQRATLFELDTAIQRLTRTVSDHAALVQLSGVYHNLLRRWSDV
jgi:PKHD-type hydroxylase